MKKLTTDAEILLENMSDAELDYITTFNLGLELKEEIKKTGVDPSQLSESPGFGVELPMWARSNNLHREVVSLAETIQDTERKFFSYHQILMINKKIIEIVREKPN